MITVRSIEGAAFGGGLGKARYLNVPDGATPAPAHEVTLSAWLAAVMATFTQPPGVSGRPGPARGDALFVVHGFNQTVEAVVKLHDSIRDGVAQHGGDYLPTLISFDWPSAGTAFAYLPDLDVAAKTAVIMVNAGVRPLLRVQMLNCQVKVNALAHSMGAFVLRVAVFGHGHALETDGQACRRRRGSAE